MIKHFFGKISVTALLLIAAAVALCVWRWDVFFHTATERDYHVTSLSPVMTVGEDAVADRSFSWSLSSSDSCFFLLQTPEEKEDTLVSRGELITTMGGEQYMHMVRLTNLLSGNYSYRILSASEEELQPAISFQIREKSTIEPLRFCLFGDLLLDENATPGELREIIRPTDTLSYDAVVYTGNIIRESTHVCWDGWYHSMAQLQAEMPQLGVPGSRDYERGICREIDPRWTYRFPMPHNGPSRFPATTSYVDYPLCRIIFLDTETLELLVDYTVLQTWLKRALIEAGDKWKIVVMHHSVHSVSAGFDHPRLYAMFHHTLDDADLILSGSDLAYGRRSDISLSDLFYDQHTVPVYMVLTSDSTEAALPKCSPMDHRIGSNRAFFSELSVSPARLEVSTRYIAHPDSIYDAYFIDYESRVVTEADSLPAEVIEKPAHYKGNALRARRFEHLRDARLRK